MSILDLNLDVLPFLQLSADDSFGNVARIQAQCEQFAKTYCARNFEPTALKEVTRRDSSGSVFLRDYPVISVRKAAIGSVKALYVSNANKSTTAQVAVSSTDVSLSYDYGAPAVFTFATNPTPTIGSLVSAINLAGNGWSASVTAGFEQTLASELIAQPSFECINNAIAPLSVPARALSEYRLNSLTGELTIDLRPPFFGDRRFVADDFFREQSSEEIHVHYTAGYAVAPQDLKMGLLALIKSVYDKLNEGTLNISLYRVEGLEKQLMDLPAETKLVLNLYQRRKI